MRTMLLAGSLVFAVASTGSLARMPIASTTTNAGGGKDIVVTIMPGETMTVKATYNTTTHPHHVVAVRPANSNTVLDAIKNSGDTMIITNQGEMRILHTYRVNGRARMTTRVKTLEVKDDYQKLGSEDGRDLDYDDAVIEITITR